MIPNITRKITDLLTAIVSSPLFSANFMAEDNLSLTPAQAYEMMRAGEAELIDIRHPREWQQTGIAKGALLVEMIDPKMAGEFAAQVRMAVDGKTDTHVILICRTDRRTSLMQAALKRLGFEVYHVSGGMLGRFGAPGWIASGLPVEHCPHC
jgi:rhodanese-related sulfurtransferase